MAAHFAGWRRAISAGGHRHEQGRMNGLERDFESEVLMPLRLAGELVSHDFECIKIRVADKAWYHPDFLAQRVDGTVDAIEVKGHWEEDARLKWKAAAELYPLFRFFAVTREGRTWRVETAFIEDRSAGLLYGALLSVRSEGVGGVASADRVSRRILPAPRKDV